MRVHHLNCISTCPLGGKLMDGRTESIIRRGHLACHCLLVETDASLVLVDTGLGLRDVADPRSRLSWFFLSLVRPDFREEMTAVRQVRRLGFDPRDVKHIVLTHLDFDHAGGLDDFPGATVHLLASERDAAVAQRTWLDRQRFRPQQWSTRDHWRVYPPGRGEPWFGFDRAQPLDGLPPEIALIPAGSEALPTLARNSATTNAAAETAPHSMPDHDPRPRPAPRPESSVDHHAAPPDPRIGKPTPLTAMRATLRLLAAPATRPCSTSRWERPC